MRDDRQRLADILEAITRIERHTVGGRQAFDGSELVQTWVVRHLEIIGEATRSLSSDLKAKHPHVPWSTIVAMRNILTHVYFGIDLDLVWAVVERDLPSLKVKVSHILAELDGMVEE